MKKIAKVIISMVLSLSICSNFIFPVHAATDLEPYIAELIYYHMNGEITDELRLLDEIKEISPDEYDKWKDVMEYWDWIEAEMVENIGVAPDGLPTDNTHAFVVLGFALKADGTMEDELVGRLETTKNSALKYPNSYILVTGGVEKNGWTEGDRMYEWLVAEGIDPARIIVENESSDTAENALFSFDKLYNSYNIKTISVITSQYHLKRGTILYYLQAMQSAKLYGKTPIELIGNGNAGWYRADKTTETMQQKANSLAQIAGGNTRSILTTFYSEPLATSVLQNLNITGDNEYTVGNPLNIKVTATYDIDNYQRDVTSLATISGYDPNKIGLQTITASYTENEVIKTIDFTVDVKATTDTSKTPDNPIDNTPNTPVPTAGDTANVTALYTLLAISSLGVAVIAKRRKEQNY